MSAHALFCLLLPIIFTAGIRGKTFSKEFMSRFKDEHQEQFPGTEPTVMGYPDMGDGRYGQQLAYGSWYNFSNSQRVHYNFVEALPYQLAFTLIAALK